MKVCSNHFLVSDYDSTIWPTRKLLKTSVPSPSNRYPKIQMRMQERKPLVQDVNLLIPEKKHKPTISQSISSKDVLKTKPSSQISDKGAPQNIEQVTDLVPYNDSKNPCKKKSFPGARYVGDFTPVYFSKPRRAHRNFQIVKNIVEKQRKKIYNLQKQTRRLEDRMNSVKNLLMHLQDRQLLSCETANAILVKCE
ncbi:hypothetical protein NQ314_008984 [Rhamnusium bicolor]|uniref:THAP-type domain-containing protein n=1 Tax=Rhamnusium bicolor TaxID=1586634 RepID=A0AAV8Y3S9_9CUCU|nr:hypothetical protein NQ314_008984 [Rhamnusium bicolor]